MESKIQMSLILTNTKRMLLVVMVTSYRGSVLRDCNINLRLNHKTPIVFHNLKKYDSHVVMQKLGKFNVKITVIPNRLERYMSFAIDNKLRFISSF